jgi:signal peptidase I
MSNNSDDSKKKTEKETPPGPPKGVVRDYFESFVVTLIMALFGMTFVLQAVTVPTASMENTILVGDYLLVNKFIFSPGDSLFFLPQREIKRGDIIVFKYPGNSLHPRKDSERGLRKYEINYVKRVIGLPGETIEFRNNQVLIDGELLPEYRMIGDHPQKSDRSQNSTAALVTSEVETRQPDQPYGVYYGKNSTEEAKKGKIQEQSYYDFAAPGHPYKIPDDSYFMMGDNRDNSEDSRFWGPVKRDLIIGRAMFVYWSCDQTTGESMSNCVSHPRFDRIFRMIK